MTFWGVLVSQRDSEQARKKVIRMTRSPRKFSRGWRNDVCPVRAEEIRGWKKMTDHRHHQILNQKSWRQAKVAREAQIAKMER
ncbi:hypothetical protein ACSC95_31345 (plasmid) [Burkholderia vietnamiensis]|uniref:hypothetical protein n=1 Tax=Burkholderia vietnamiensis TaxID=60552 RepID=UPI001593C72E|nr:hypothetical protein [Burkholderia vietnamiensis]MBR8151548.1 hypothetical protein [Burkholderia vietnamiensis]MCA8232364.1 hypothetical protein [Burkholderia vietnamiensis]HDR8918824.1 hypothetical protein [Burkholderia vietnamiensis]HDR8977016.1 hypothetical protein [Burkholderia vietnamiensis]